MVKGSAIIESSQEAFLKGEVILEESLSGTITNEEKTLSANATIGSFHETYSGDYEITPKTKSQIFNTSNKLMTQDTTVKAIPYYSVSNQYNGQTIIIGGND